MFNKIKRYFWAIYLFPDNALTFFSGIFVAVSVNILTSQIPQSVFAIGWTYFLAAILLFMLAGILLWWSVIIKPFHSEYNNSIDIQKSLGTLNCWYNFINRKTPQAKSTRKKLVIFLLLIIFLFALCIILLLFPDYFKKTVDCVFNKVNNVEG